MACARSLLATRMANGSCTLQDYPAQPHITISFHTPGNNRIDAALGSQGHKRQVAIRTHSFAGVLQALPGTDLIATMPRRLVKALANENHLVFPLPMHVAPYDYGVVWHR